MTVNAPTITRAQFLAAVDARDWWLGGVSFDDFVNAALRDETLALTSHFVGQLEQALKGRKRTLDNLRKLAQ